MPGIEAEIWIKPFRLLTMSAAAHYCARPGRTFEANCPVLPLLMPNGDKLYDVRDLDAWIDSLKRGGAQDAASLALERLR